MGNFKVLIFFMKLFQVYPSNREKSVGLRRATINSLTVSPLFFVILPNIAHFVKFFEQADIESITDYVYTLALFLMLVVNYIIFAARQIELRDNLHRLNTFIEKSSLNSKIFPHVSGAKSRSFAGKLEGRAQLYSKTDESNDRNMLKLCIVGVLGVFAMPVVKPLFDCLVGKYSPEKSWYTPYKS